MAAAAQIVEGMGADIVDVNMGCPVPKIAKHNAGCSLMREPAHAAGVIAAMARAVKIPVTVKMRAGWNDDGAERADAGAGWSRTRAPRRSPSTGGPRRRATAARRTGIWWRGSRTSLTIPVFGSGDCIEPEQIVERHARPACEGVLVGRGVLRNPWILAQAADLRRRPRAAAGHAGGSRQLPARVHRSADARAIGRSARVMTHDKLGRQQAARARLLVHEGPRERLASPDRDQQRRVARRTARDHRGVLLLPAARVRERERIR